MNCPVAGLYRSAVATTPAFVVPPATSTTPLYMRAADAPARADTKSPVADHVFAAGGGTADTLSANKVIPASTSAPAVLSPLATGVALGNHRNLSISLSNRCDVPKLLCRSAQSARLRGWVRRVERAEQQQR